MRTTEFSQGEKEVIWFYGRLNDLKVAGLVNGECCENQLAISVKGLSIYDQLVAEGFKPDEECISELVKLFLKATGDDNKLWTTLLLKVQTD